MMVSLQITSWKYTEIEENMVKSTAEFLKADI